MSNPPPKPAEYLGHNGPIICYAGAWASWIDQNLIMRTAMSFPNALIAIIGVEFFPPLSKLIKNVRHIGYKPYETLPQYIYCSDVCIIPFKINGITIAANPVKMYEYLSSGKPVISTDLPEARNIPGVYTASDSASFIFWIKKILNKEIIPDSEGIKIWLRSQTWESRFQNVIEMLRKTWTDI
ncbi:MAG TPA: hypothetical protein DD426_03660 [Clostridiaceae bacterium]|nr:hypothetical protein [Clostridiaceae bacterium]